MAYAPSNPPLLVAPSRDGNGPALWAYSSADPLNIVTQSGYFANASNIGMMLGDFVLVSETDNGYAPVVLAVSSIISGAATAGGAGKMIPAGDGILSGTDTICKTGISRNGDIIVTRMILDITGLNSGGTAGDIIGKNGGGAAYLGQITAALNGTIFAVRIQCLELPVGGDTDIDLYSATEATGVEDAAISSLTATQIINSSVWTQGASKVGGNIAADQYLYLVGQGTANATYTAGLFFVEIYGY